MEPTSISPLVSIVMPAYNSGTLISDSIHSVINQTYKNWELIVIDDGSKDNTFELIYSLSKIEPRIKPIKQENQGIGATRNNGYKASSGDWIAFLDHDDLWHEHKLERQIQAALSDESFEVIYTGGWFFYNNDKGELTPYRSIFGTFANNDMYLRQLEENYIATLSVMVKRSLIERIGPWDERKLVQGCDDYDYWFRMAKAGAKFLGLDEQLFYYRKHQNNYSNDAAKMLIAEANVLIKNFDRKILNTRDQLKKFEKKIHSILLSLLRLREIDKVLDVLKELNALLPSIYMTSSTIALKVFRHNAFFAVKCLFKAERLIN